jgi:hypothetical protein
LDAILKTAHNLLRNQALRPAFLREEAVMPDPSADRPKSRETEYEDVRPKTPGPPRAATEPRGSEGSVKTSRTATDPGSGEARDPPDPKATSPPRRRGP